MTRFTTPLQQILTVPPLSIAIYIIKPLLFLMGNRDSQVRWAYSFLAAAILNLKRIQMSFRRRCRLVVVVTSHIVDLFLFLNCQLFIKKRIRIIGILFNQKKTKPLAHNIKNIYPSNMTVCQSNILIFWFFNFFHSIYFFFFIWFQVWDKKRRGIKQGKLKTLVNTINPKL